MILSSSGQLVAWSERVEVQTFLLGFVLSAEPVSNTFRTVDQMAEWYRASASGWVNLGFDSKSGQTNDFKIGIHSFPA